MTKHSPLNADCSAGFNAPSGATNPFLFSSDSWLAWEAGKWLNESGQCGPVSVRKSRGFSIRALTSSGVKQHMVFAGPDLVRSYREHIAA